MGKGIEVVLSILLTVWTIEDLLFKKIRTWELVVGTAVMVIFMTIEKVDIKELLPGIIVSFMFIIVSLLSKGNFGLGDSWVIGIAGLGLDFQEFTFMLGASFCVAAFVSVIMILLKKSSRKTKIPFVPFLLAGFLTQFMF